MLKEITIFSIKHWRYQQMTKDNLTPQQFKTLFLVNAINIIANSNKSEDAIYKCAGDIYFQSFINDPKTTIQLLKEILELEELGYVKTTYTAEDLQNDAKICSRFKDTLKIKVLVSLSEIKNELQISDEELLNIVEDAWESDEIQELLDGKINKKDFLKAFEDFLEGNLVQDSVDIISKIGIPAFLVLAGIFAAHYFINKK